MGETDVCNDQPTLLLSLVGKHGPKSNVADALDTLGAGVKLVINDNPSLLVSFNTNSFEIETLSNGSSTNGDEHNVGLNGFLLAALGRIDLELDDVTLPMAGNNLSVELELEALFGEDSLELLATKQLTKVTSFRCRGNLPNLAIHAGADSSQIFDNRNLGT